MNQISPSHPALDKTSDAYYAPIEAFETAAQRHSAAFPAADLVDLVANFEAVDLQRLLAAVRSADATAAGKMLVDAFANEICRLADWSIGA